jgi:hypothetical protein
MVACHPAEDNGYFPLHRNLAEEVADAEGHRPHKNRVAVFRDPDQVDREIIFAVRPTPVPWRVGILSHPRTRLKARVFHRL